MFIILGSLVLICFQSRQILSWNFVVLFSTFHWLKKKRLKSIASVLLHDWLTLPGWPITCPPIPTPPQGRNTVHWDYFSVNTGNVLQSNALEHWHPTKFLTSFWQVFDPVWNGPIRLSEQVWTRYKKHCMFVCQISKLEVDRSLQECSQERIGDK